MTPVEDPVDIRSAAAAEAAELAAARKDILRIATAGSVDDGKSTLIGRLLFDSKAVFEDQYEAVERISERGATRADDQTSESAMEDRKKEGYF